MYVQQRHRIKCNTHSPHSTRWSSREAAAFHWRPPKPSEASAFVRSLIGSPRPHSAFCLTTFLETTREGIMNTWTIHSDKSLLSYQRQMSKQCLKRKMTQPKWFSCPSQCSHHWRLWWLQKCANVLAAHKQIRQRLNFRSEQCNEICSKYIE